MGSIIRSIKKRINPPNFDEYYALGEIYFNDKFHALGKGLSIQEDLKTPSRTEVIKGLISLFPETSKYLEIGVRNPSDNFDLIPAGEKYSVDPGLEFEENPVDFRMTSDVFFQGLDQGEILSSEIKFDLIFIDGLHLAEQVDRDIQNALRYLKEDGFIVLHDCNPPTEWHARDTFEYSHSPAGVSWNGTTWKAFLKWRFEPSVYSCCIDTDWGVGVVSKRHNIGEAIEQTNPFFEYNDLAENRERYLNLISYQAFKESINSMR